MQKASVVNGFWVFEDSIMFYLCSFVKHPSFVGTIDLQTEHPKLKKL